MNSIDYATMRGIAVEAGLDPDESVRTRYSGRGMFGKECVGFDLDHTAELLSLGAAILTECGTDVLEEFVNSIRSDSMGTGIVVYFPGITCEGGPDGDED